MQMSPGARMVTRLGEHCGSFLAIPSINAKLHPFQWASAPPYAKKGFSLENHRLPVSCVETGCFEAALDIELVVILPEGFGKGGDDDKCSSPEGKRRRALAAIPGCPQAHAYGMKSWSRRWPRKVPYLFT